MSGFACFCFAPLDLETDERYVISPISGRLSVVPSHVWENMDWQNRILLAEGINAIENYSPLISASECQRPFTVSASANPISCWFIVQLSRFAAKFLPLRFYIKQISRLPVNNKRLPVENIVNLLRRVPAYHSANCLVRSLAQAFLLKRNGQPFDLTVGVWIPTTRMHAWTSVQVEGEHLFVDDSMDKVAHYQPVVIFSAS